MRLGILGCSEIAFRRFMPAVMEIDGIEVVAVAEEYDQSKLDPFCKEYNLEGMDSFEKLIQREDIDSVYVPQPPALHYQWANLALLEGKHVLIEKPSTIQYADSQKLVQLAEEKKLALHENYMFQYHSQIRQIKNIVSQGTIGEIRNIRCDFGFPMRMKNDFRYNRQLGGGALLDAGGYTAKLATLFLGKTIRVDAAMLNILPDFEVDMYGSVQFSNDKGMVCQSSFGMDNGYRCSLEIWGSKGRIYTNRIFTAPENYQPVIFVETAEKNEEIVLDKDMHFKKSIEEFVGEIKDAKKRKKMYDEIVLQAKLVNDIRTIGTR